MAASGEPDGVGAALLAVPNHVYKNAEQDAVRNAFSQRSFGGIRSLPNALAPDFRRSLYEELRAAMRKVSGRR